MTPEEWQLRERELRAGIASACVEEDEIRDLGFLDIPVYSIGGIEVPTMTVETMNILGVARSPYIVGGFKTLDDACKLAWILHEQDRPWWKRIGNVSKRRNRFLKRLDMSTVMMDAREYIDAVFFDAPQSSGGNNHGIASCSAYLVHTIATNYGWSKREIMKLKLPEIYQCIRLIKRSNNPKAIIMNPLVHAARNEWLEFVHANNPIQHN